MFDDCDDWDDWDDCDECDAEDDGGADGAAFLDGGAIKSERESLCCCGLSTVVDEGGGLNECPAGAELFTAGAPIGCWSGLMTLLFPPELGVL